MNPLLPEDVQRHLVLASRSPRRIDILRGLGFEFDIDPATESIEESVATDDAYGLPVVLAGRKADEVSARHPESIVIGADTVVIIDGDILQKPQDDNEAAEHIRRLSGAEHVVVTGIAIRRRSAGLRLSGKEATRVRFRELTAREVENYVASGEGRDKAGAYAVQGLGAALVRSIHGCYYNVVGLPVGLLFDLLKAVHKS